MRLGSCIAIELAVGASAVIAFGAAAAVGWHELRSDWESSAHAAQERAARSRPDIQLEARPRLDPTPGLVSVFDGVSDERLLAPLREARIERVRVNRGGSSISLRIDFVGGFRAAFKPRQLNWQTIPRREVAAFRINRILGLNSVPPAIGRAFATEELLAALDPRDAYLLPRLRAEIIAENDLVAGELSWWIPVIGHASVGGLRVDSPEGIRLWSQYLTAGAAVPPTEWRTVAQVSDMVVFDFLINNLDRWSGGNARSSPDGRVVYCMDNTMSFGANPLGHERTRAYLNRVQKFSASLVSALRSLDGQQVRVELSTDIEPFDTLLDDHELEAFMARRNEVVAYVDSLVRTHGSHRILVFP